MRRLDLFRARVLKATLRSSWLRAVFFERPYRLGFFFAASVCANLFLSLKAPLWALLVGPLIFGVPHLASSLRYVPRLTLRGPASPAPRLYALVALVFIGVAALRVWELRHPGVLGGEGLLNLPELGVAGLVLLGLAGIRARLAEALTTGLLLLSLGGLTWFWPYETLGALVLVHGFVGFIYWARRSARTGDRACALLSLGVFTALTALILSGGFDSWIASRPLSIFNGSLDELSIGALIFPRGSALLGFRAVSAYAFGQGVHYFVWLKAIPELELPHGHPASFAQSVRLLDRELGHGLWVGTGLLGLALIGATAFVALPQIRIVYLAAASFHGYLELAGVALVRRIALS